MILIFVLGYLCIALEHKLRIDNLSTAGEVIGLRIKTGRYNEPGFGILPFPLRNETLTIKHQPSCQQH